MATNNPPSPNGNKRKRGQQEDVSRNLKAQSTNGDGGVSDAMYASLLQGITDSPMPTQEETSRTAQAALQQQQSAYPEPNVFDHAGVQAGFGDHSAHMQQNIPQHQMNTGGQGIFDARQTQPGNKPQVGTAAWHQQRKDNHKEVERRRREVINEGIENIAKLIPSTDKNKGAVLGNACRFITELQSKVEAFNNERNVFEITQQELTRRNETLRESAERSWRETAKWMQRCRDAGLQFDDYDNIETQARLDDSASATNLEGHAGFGPTAGDKADDGLS